MREVKTMRKLMRQRARAMMAQRGLCKVNKRVYDRKSYFSLHWREFV